MEPGWLEVTLPIHVRKNSAQANKAWYSQRSFKRAFFRSGFPAIRSEASNGNGSLHFNLDLHLLGFY